MAEVKAIAGPAYLSSSAANIYTPPNAAVWVGITHIHFANVTAAGKTFSLYKGATGGSAGGTELFKDYPLEANATYDWYPVKALKMVSTDFLTGLASAGSSVTITVNGYYEAT